MKPFQYYLLEEDGRSIKVQNGVVTSTGTPTPLPHTPDKWQEISVSWERDLAKHGITRNFSTGIDHVRDGAKIIREAFYNTNVERRIYLLIQRLTLDLDTNFFKWVYRYFYKGEIDLSTVNDTDFTTTVNIMEGNLVRKLKAFEDFQYTIPIDADTGMKTVKMDGMYLSKKQNWLIPAYVILEVLGDNKHLIGAADTTTEGNAAGFTGFTQYHDKNIPSDYTTDLRYFFITTQAITGMRFVGKIQVTDPNNDGDNYKAELKTSEGNTITLVPSTALAEGVNTFDIDVTFDAVSGEKFFFQGEYGGGSTSSVQYYETEFYISAITRYPTSYIKGLTAWTLYQRLIEKITGSTDNADSDLLQQYENILITCGDAIRGLPNASIKTSLNDFYKSLDAVLCAGMGVENNKIIFEDRDHFYDTSDPVSLGSVRNCKRSYSKELLANTFKIGYPDSKIDDANGKYEFNNSHLYTSPVTRVVKEHQITSVYKTSPYLIETTRINLDGKTTTDNSIDNDVFMLNTEPDQDETVDTTVSFVASGSYIICDTSLQFIEGQTISFTGSVNDGHIFKVTGVLNLLLFQFVILESVPAGYSIVDDATVAVTITWHSGIMQKLLRVTYDEVEGIPDESIETIFNIELFTPKRMLYRHGKWIRSMLHGFDMEKLIFRTTEKNPGLRTVLGSEVYDEDADVNIGDLEEPMFIPVAEEFETETPADLVDFFEAGPNRCFEYTDGYGLTRKGFNMKSALMPNTLQPQGFKVLWAVSNDGSGLVI